MGITIKKNDYDEYEVPTVIGVTGADQIYFASDRDDALDTARHIHGQNVKVTFRSGTYMRSGIYINIEEN